MERRPREASDHGLRLSRAAIPFGDLGAGPAVSALAPAAYGGAMMLGRFSGQWLEGRLGDTLLLGGAMCVALVGLVAASLAPNAPVAVIAFFVGGAGISIAAPTLFGAGGRGASARERGKAVATVTTIGYLGFLVGPPLVGGVAEAVGPASAFRDVGGPGPNTSRRGDDSSGRGTATDASPAGLRANVCPDTTCLSGTWGVLAPTRPGETMA